jgi:hypothetical protein
MLGYCRGFGQHDGIIDMNDLCRELRGVCLWIIPRSFSFENERGIFHVAGFRLF